jgi:PKD repeat protein
VDIVDGKELASFNLTVDLRFLKENALQGADAGEKKYAIAIRIASNDREVNPDLNTLIVVIDTKMMNPVADFYTQTETVWNQILFTSTAKYATAYHWSFGDATEISDYKPRHTYGQSGIYAVTLTVTGIAGDVVSKTIALPVLNILPLDKLEWSVVDFSSEELGEATTAYPELGHVTAVFDDNIATYWSSAYLTTIASSPHWFVLDLGATYTIRTIKTEKRQNNSNGQRAYRLFTSIDGINWEDHGQYAINQSLNQTIVLDLDYPQAQYIKYEAVRGGATRDIAFLAEITVFGTLAE